MTGRRPALAQILRRTADDAAGYRYDEDMQLSVWEDGSPAVGAGAIGETETFAERDRPDPSTNTRAERDPGDLVDETFSRRQALQRVTATNTRGDQGDPTTVTKAAGDPSDMMDATLAHRLELLSEILTEAERDHGDPAEPDDRSSDDLVTGIVAF